MRRAMKIVQNFKNIFSCVLSGVFDSIVTVYREDGILGFFAYVRLSFFLFLVGTPSFWCIAMMVNFESFCCECCHH